MRVCYVCGTNAGIERHHVFGGPYRNKSDKYGFMRDLCAEHHRNGKYSAHRNRSLNLWLKQECQREFEKSYSREEFIREFGKSYLED
jgi:hypothetical protein